MKYGFAFLIVALLLLLYALQQGGWFYGLLYPALSFMLVATAYLGVGPRVFGKRACGKRSWLSTMLLLPYLLFSLATWHLIRLLSRESAIAKLDGDLYLARRLRIGELPESVNSVVDLTCEFSDPMSTSIDYLCVPILDASSPSAQELSEIADRILALAKPTLIHCAQGHGRTGLVAAAVLLRSGRAKSSAEALAMIKAVRPGVELNAVQQRAVEIVEFQHNSSRE